MKFLKMSVIIAIILASGSCVQGQADDFKLIIDYSECLLLGRQAIFPVYFQGNINVVDSLHLLIKYHTGVFKLESLSFETIILIQ